MKTKIKTCRVMLFCLLFVFLLSGCGQVLSLSPGASIHEIALGPSLAGITFATADDSRVKHKSPYPGLREEDLDKAKNAGVIQGWEYTENDFGTVLRVKGPKDSPFAAIDFQINQETYDDRAELESIVCHLPSYDGSLPLEQVLASHTIELKRPAFAMDSGDILYTYRLGGMEVDSFNTRLVCIGPDPTGIPCLKGFAWHPCAASYPPKHGRSWEKMLKEARFARRWFQSGLLDEYGAIFAGDVTGDTPQDLRRPGAVVQALPLIMARFEKAEGPQKSRVTAEAVNAFLRRRGSFNDEQRWQAALVAEAHRLGESEAKAGHPAAAYGWHITAARLSQDPAELEAVHTKATTELKGYLAEAAIGIELPPCPGVTPGEETPLLRTAPIDDVLARSEIKPAAMVKVTLGEPVIKLSSKTQSAEKTRKKRLENHDWTSWKAQRDSLVNLERMAADRLLAQKGYVIKGGYGYKIIGRYSDGTPITEDHPSHVPDSVDPVLKKKYDDAEKLLNEASAELEAFDRASSRPPMFDYKVFNWTVHLQTWEGKATQSVTVSVDGKEEEPQTLSWTCARSLLKVTGDPPEDIAKMDEWLTEESLTAEANKSLWNQAADLAQAKAQIVRARRVQVLIDGLKGTEESQWLVWLFGTDGNRSGLPVAALSVQGPSGTDPKEQQRLVAQSLGLPIQRTLALGKGATMDMVLIPPGIYTTSLGKNAEKTHRVWITRPFYMSVTEVTSDQYHAVMSGWTASKDKPPFPTTAKDPKMIMEFAKKVGSLHEETCTLPTEAQWELACRAGATTRFFNGDGIDAARRAGWMLFPGEEKGELHSVAQCKPNAWGLYDMHGNARELCLDAWRDSGIRFEIDSPDPFCDNYDSYSPKYVLRGGTFETPWEECGASDREGGYGGKFYTSMGFRLILVIDVKDDNG